MCDMYGHGWWDDMKGVAVCDYMHKNSHGEFNLDLPQVYVKRLSPAPRRIERFAQALRRVRVKPRYIPYGLDPVDGKLIWKGDLYTEDPAVGPITRYATAIRASWDYEIPTIEEMCKWFDAHFGERGDLMNWLQRGPLLLAERPRQRFLERGPRDEQLAVSVREDSDDFNFIPRFSASELIDAFRKNPNEYWERSRHEARRELAARVLELDSGCEACIATVTIS